MKAIFGLIFVATLTAVAAHAADVLNGETLVRTISAGQASLVLFKNPNGDSSRTLVTCVPSAALAKQTLANDKMGGIVLIPGSKIVFKNDTSTSFNDGTNLKGNFIRIECK